MDLPRKSGELSGLGRLPPSCRTYSVSKANQKADILGSMINTILS